MLGWRNRSRGPLHAVTDGRVACPVTGRREDLEGCLACGRLTATERDTNGDVVTAVRCRADAPWRDVPAVFLR